MSGRPGPDEAAILREIGAEIHRFIQANPNNYAARALAGVINREAGGETIGEE